VVCVVSACLAWCAFELVGWAAGGVDGGGAADGAGSEVAFASA